MKIVVYPEDSREIADAENLVNVLSCMAPTLATARVTGTSVEVHSRTDPPHVASQIGPVLDASDRLATDTRVLAQLWLPDGDPLGWLPDGPDLGTPPWLKIGGRK